MTDTRARDVIALALRQFFGGNAGGPLIGDQHGDDQAEFATNAALAALSDAGLVVLDRTLLDELLAASFEACREESWREGRKASWYLRLTDARLTVRRAVVEAVGPTTPETCSTCNQPLDSPPCSFNRGTGWSGHTVYGGVGVGPTT